ALRSGLVLERVEPRESRERRQAFVDPRVVFHRAGAEGIEARVDAEVARGELGEVADELELRYLRQARRVAAAGRLRYLRRREALVAREVGGSATGLRLLVDEPHPDPSASTSARRSICSGVRRSVTATSRTSSSPS